MSIGALYPIIKPSLLLDFAKTKQLDPRITFTRASTATYYDGETSALAEQNLLTYSQLLTNGVWIAAGCTPTANSNVAPDGTTTGNLLTIASSGLFVQQVSVTAGVTYTASFYALAGTATTVNYLIYNVTGNSVIVASTNYYSLINSSTWTRISFQFTAPAGCTSIYFDMARASSVGTVYLWGAQLEQRSSVTAYTPTTTAAITNYIPVLLTAQAGQARFDHNPTTGDSLGLEIEEQRTNLQTYSEDFGNAAWSKVRASITSNTIIAPDGTLTGDKLVEDTTASNNHYAFFATSIAISNATSYTFTIYAKAGERSQIGIQGDGSVGFLGSITYFNLATGAVISTPAGVTSSIASVGNGWYRCSVTATSTGTTANPIVFLASSGSVGYTGNGFSGVYIWGAQLEAGAFATSYIPTVASQITRSADTASITGTNFSSWYRTDEGTVYAEAISTNTSSANEGIITIQQGTSANLMGLGRKYAGGSTTTVSWWVYTDAITQAYLSVGTVTANVSYKVSATYKTNDIAVSFNGAAPAVDTSAILATQTQLFIGKTYANEHLNGTIKKLAYYPKRLTNTELQGLTS